MRKQAPELERIRRSLLSRSYLYDDPRTYCAGVETAIEAIRVRLRDLPPARSEPAERVRMRA